MQRILPDESTQAAEGVPPSRAKPRTMSEHQASRTLLKSPPELWAECSDPQSLARHLDEFFGEIRITRLEPEKAVAWEGERVSGTVRLEPSGWGTKVTLTANEPAPERLGEEPAPEPPAEEPAPEPIATAPEQRADPVSIASDQPPPSGPPKPSRMGFMGRIRYLLSTPTAPASQLSLEPVVAAVADAVPPAPEPDPAVPEPSTWQASVGTTPKSEAALSAALDSLGKAHHRPFSRG